MLVVSHPAAVTTNQLVPAALVAMGVNCHLVTPRSWRHAYHPDPFEVETLAGLEGRHRRLRVLGRGQPQRHVYLARIVRLLRALDPEVCYIEEECFSLPALQWALACRRLGIPFGIQAWENLDRPLPRVARAIRRLVLPRAAFVLARTPAAASMVTRWGATGTVGVVGSPVPSTELAPRTPHDGFVVGVAGRLVPEKNVVAVAEAVAAMDGARLVVAGDGPERDRLAAMANVAVRTDLRHEAMASFFASCDVVCLASIATPTWAEQFGRVLVEAMVQGTPVVGSTCGEIPWVVESTGGGIIVDVATHGALRAALVTLRDDPDARRAMGQRGRAAVLERFSVDAAARGLLDLCRAVAR